MVSPFLAYPITPEEQSLLSLLPFVLLIVVFFLVVALFRWLWNITMPEVFGVRTISFWQAFRLLLLSQLLFGGAWVRYHL